MFFLRKVVLVLLLSSTLAQAQDAASNSVQSEQSAHHKLGLGLRLGNRLSFDSMKVTSGSLSQTSKGEFRSNTVPVVLEYQYSNMPQNAWGWNAGFNFFTVQWDDFSVSGSSFTVNDKTSFLVPFANAVYRWNSVYLPFGLNVTSISNSGDSEVLNDAKGFLGLQLGVGFLVSDLVTILIESKAVGITTSKYTQGALTLDPGVGVAGGLNLTVLFSL